MDTDQESRPAGEPVCAGRPLKRTKLSIADLIPEYPGYRYENGYNSKLKRGDVVCLVDRNGGLVGEMTFLGCIPHRVSFTMPVFKWSDKIVTAYDVCFGVPGCGWIKPEAFYSAEDLASPTRLKRESRITQSGEYIEEVEDGASPGSE